MKRLHDTLDLFRDRIPGDVKLLESAATGGEEAIFTEELLATLVNGQVSVTPPERDLLTRMVNEFDDDPEIAESAHRFLTRLTVAPSAS